MISATKKYASPVSKRCFKQKYPDKLFRRMFRSAKKITAFQDKLMSAMPHHRYTCPVHGEWRSRLPVPSKACISLFTVKVGEDEKLVKCGQISEPVALKKPYKKPSPAAKRKRKAAMRNNDKNS